MRLGILEYKYNFYLRYKIKKIKLNLKKFFNSGIFNFIVIVLGLGFLAFLISLIKLDNGFISFLKTITIGFLPGNMLKEFYIGGIVLLILSVIAIIFKIIGKACGLIKHPIRSLIILGIIFLIDFIKSALLEERFPILYDSSLLRKVINRFFIKHNLGGFIKGERFSSFLSSFLSSFIPFFMKHGILIVVLFIIFIVFIINISKKIRWNTNYRKYTKISKERHFNFDDSELDDTTIDLSEPVSNYLHK